VAEEPGNVSHTIRFVSVNCIKVILECGFKAFRPDAIELAESFADETVVSRVGTFLGATFNDHVDEFNLAGA
jgi:hypothetical protein